jgi:hypothetical protein
LKNTTEDQAKPDLTFFQPEITKIIKHTLKKERGENISKD